MKEIIYVFLILLCFGCENSNKVRSIHKSKQLSTSKKKDNFKEFIKNFSLDSCFQINHISFPLEVQYSGYDYEEEDSVFHINKSDWIYTNFCDSVIEGQKVFTIIDESKNIVVLKGYDSGIYLTYYYRSTNGT